MSDEFKETPSIGSSKDTAARTDPSQYDSAVQGLSPESQHSMKQAHQLGDYLHDVNDFRKDPEVIKKFSKETRDNYFEARIQKVEAEANQLVKPVLVELKQKHAERSEVFDALDQVYGEHDFKKMEYWESCGSVPTLETNDQLRTVYKYHEGNIDSHFYTPEYMVDLERRQDRLSLPTKGAFGDQYLMDPGARYLKSAAAPKFNHSGGGEQWLVIDKDKVIKPNW